MGGIFNPRYYHGFLLSGSNGPSSLIGRWAYDAEGFHFDTEEHYWPDGKFVPGRIISIEIHALDSYSKLGVFIRTTGSDVDLISSEHWIETEMAG